jgi:lysozyme
VRSRCGGRRLQTKNFILKVYKDIRGLPTVGAGHLIVAADKLKVGVPLHQYEYDALVSLTFNTGAHGASKLFNAVNTGKYESIPATIEKYRIGGGNEGRRESEAELFKSGVYDASH